jgi:serine/threonine protein kinase
MQDRQRLIGRLDPDVVTDEAVKFALLAQAGAALAWLHARGVVFGDVSSTNMVVALEPPRLMLLDCDAVCTSPATASAKGRNTPFYVPPEHLVNGLSPTVNEQTDVWKTALLALRTLTPGKGAMQRKPKELGRLSGTVPRELVDLLRAALADDPAKRPSSAALSACLGEIAVRLTSPPRAARLDVVDDVCRRGAVVSIGWEFDSVSRIRVVSPNGVTHDLAAPANPGTVDFPADTSGLISLHAANRHGTSSYVLGPIAVYDVPDVHIALNLPALPRPIDGFSTRLLAGPSLPVVREPPPPRLPPEPSTDRRTALARSRFDGLIDRVVGAGLPRRRNWP